MRNAGGEIQHHAYSFIWTSVRKLKLPSPRCWLSVFHESRKWILEFPFSLYSCSSKSFRWLTWTWSQPQHQLSSCRQVDKSYRFPLNTWKYSWIFDLLELRRDDDCTKLNLSNTTKYRHKMATLMFCEFHSQRPGCLTLGHQRDMVVIHLPTPIMDTPKSCTPIIPIFLQLREPRDNLTIWHPTLPLRPIRRVPHSASGPEISSKTLPCCLSLCP